MKEHEALYRDLEDPARRAYGAIVTTTDHYIGKIVNKIDSLGLRENTIVIFMSDNGHSEETKNRIRFDKHKSGHPLDHFYGASGGGNTGKWIGKKGDFLEGGIRVPAIIRYPGKIAMDESRDQIITAMDWFPTLLELCEIDLEDRPSFDGHSLVPILESEDAPSGYDGQLHFQFHLHWMVRDGDWKLIGRNNQPGKYWLHNLGDEEPEVINYADAKPEIVARLKSMHDNWAKEVEPK